MPESLKPTRHAQLAAEFAHAAAPVAGATIVKLADGAQENWRIAIAPIGIEVVDYFHACEHLQKAFNAYDGEGSAEAKLYAEQYRSHLKDQDDGPAMVIRALAYRLKRCQGRKAKLLEAELTFFRNHQHQMPYADHVRRGLPIGSGGVEAACKTLVTARLKLSGLRWSIPGGQAILTLRSLIQSGRWDRGWALIRQSYRQTVILLPEKGQKTDDNKITA
jgi:hypothetical protein